MVTSRTIPDIANAFTEALKLEVHTSKEDVKRFVAGQTYRLPAYIQRSAALQEMVQEQIVEAADGMFLLVRLHTDSLLDKRTAKSVKSTLARLSKGVDALDDAYGNVLQRIEGQLDGDRRLAKDTLSWIIFAKRPLTTAEICCALAIEPGESEIDPEGIPDVDDLVSVCAGLVAVDQKSAVIRLVHYTTQEYFERIGRAWNPDCQLHITTMCLTYLCSDAFRGGSCSTDKELQQRLNQNEFLDYAAKYLGEHARPVESEVASLVCSFLLNSHLLSSAAQVLFIPRYKRQGNDREYRVVTGLHWIARFGLCGVAKEFLCSTEEDVISAVNAKDSWGHAPLLLAVEYGHYEMVELLLDEGADPIALCAASSRGYEQIVKTLVSAGANVNSGDEVFGNALYAASSGGYEQIMKILVSAGANVNAESGVLGNALYVASFRGYEQIMKTLVSAGANVNVGGGRYGNALHAALSGGHEQVARLLLEKGADPL